MIWNFVKFNPCFFLRVQKRKKEIVLFERIQSISISAPSIAFLFSFIFLILYFFQLQICTMGQPDSALGQSVF